MDEGVRRARQGMVQGRHEPQAEALFFRLVRDAIQILPVGRTRMGRHGRNPDICRAVTFVFERRKRYQHVVSIVHRRLIRLQHLVKQRRLVRDCAAIDREIAGERAPDRA